MARSNWSQTDYFLALPLSGDNALKDIKGGKVATNNGATFDGNGVVLAGAEWIDTNYIPSVDGINHTLNNANIAAFVVESTGNLATIFYLIGGAGSGNGHTNIRNGGDGTLRTGINGTTSTNQFIGEFEDNSLYSGIREISTLSFLKDGVVIDTRAASPIVLPNVSLKIGQQAGANFFTGTVSSFITGAAIGFDQVAHEDNLRTLLTNLGVTL